MTTLSVIVPAYNEEKNIAPAIDDIFLHIAKVVPELEIVVVDDGSKDKTAETLQRLESDQPQLRVITQRNAGHGAALLNGIAQSKGNWLLFLDSDRQVALDQFSDHWAMKSSYDAIFGIRKNRNDPMHRKVISFCMKFVLQALTGVRPSDAGAPYKLLRRDVWEDARRFISDDCWIPSVLLAVRAKRRLGARCLETPIVHLPRNHGPSSLNLPRLAKFCTMATLDVIRFRRHQQQSGLVKA